MPLHIPTKLNMLLLSIQVAATTAAVARLMNVGGATAAAQQCRQFGPRYRIGKNNKWLVVSVSGREKFYVSATP